jgi:hypothetical protein
VLLEAHNKKVQVMLCISNLCRCKPFHLNELATHVRQTITTPIRRQKDSCRCEFGRVHTGEQLCPLVVEMLSSYQGCRIVVCSVGLPDTIYTTESMLGFCLHIMKIQSWRPSISHGTNAQGDLRRGNSVLKDTP